MPSTRKPDTQRKIIGRTTQTLEGAPRTTPSESPQASLGATVPSPAGSDTQQANVANVTRPSSRTEEWRKWGAEVMDFLGDLKEVVEFLAILYAAIALTTQIEKNSQAIFLVNLLLRDFAVNLLVFIAVSLFLTLLIWEFKRWLKLPLENKSP